MVATTRTDIEKELFLLSSRANLSDAINALEIFRIPDNAYDLSVIEPWHRSGAETYLTRFSVSNQSGEMFDLVLKACTPSSISIPIETVMARWLARRRSLVAKFGISFFPKLYAAGSGVLLEEFIPYSFQEYLSRSSDVIVNAIDFFNQLRMMGYNVNLLFADVRSRGSDIVFIDFGQDLGEPDSKPGPSYFQPLIAYCHAQGVDQRVIAVIERELIKELDQSIH